MDATLAAIIVVCVLCGVIAGSIAWSRVGTNGAFFGLFILGALLPIIGIIVACTLQRPVLPPQPPGWYVDPWGQAPLRWFDGAAWSWQTAAGEIPAT